MDVERGPDWLFVRLRDVWTASDPGVNLAEAVWNELQRQFAHRLVLELDDVPVLRSFLLGELVLLQKRIHEAGGVLRLSGVSEQGQEALRLARLHDLFPGYHNREEAVLGHRPLRPR